MRCSNSPLVFGWFAGGLPDAVGRAMMGILATVTREFCRRAYRRSCLSRAWAIPSFLQNSNVDSLELLRRKRVREAALEISQRRRGGGGVGKLVAGVRARFAGEHAAQRGDFHREPLLRLLDRVEPCQVIRRRGRALCGAYGARGVLELLGDDRE